MSYFCDDKQYTYKNGYIALQLGDFVLPENISIDNEEFFRKSEFHVSLLCLKNILEKEPEVESRTLKTFCDFVKVNPIRLSNFTGEFNLVVDSVRDRKSVIAMCEVENLPEFFSHLSSEINIEIPLQPAHVTLFTLQLNAGIGVNSSTDLAQNAVYVEVPEIVKKALKV